MTPARSVHRHRVLRGAWRRLGPAQLSAATAAAGPGVPLVADGGTWRIERA
ncbi:hypothetical protein [Rhodococcus aetherivorans]|nr:hypothetical protein [Rhodococcus aetherivorans]MBC2591914.1 hypothetical protein [Rhodococcus aetherivorans]